ncbi:hypothetical protein T08_11780 [Trichinella sp. T8]|nr:hypothetical protein T08_11780 [Trichinella sp. T8]
MAENHQPIWMHHSFNVVSEINTSPITRKGRNSSRQFYFT